MSDSNVDRVKATAAIAAWTGRRMCSGCQTHQPVEHLTKLRPTSNHPSARPRYVCQHCAAAAKKRRSAA